MKEEVKEVEVVESDVKFVNFTLALGTGAPSGSVGLLEAEQSFKEKYSDYTVLIAQVVSAKESHLQLFLILQKK